MKKVIRLTESDLRKIVKRILKESHFEDNDTPLEDMSDFDDNDYGEEDDDITDYGFDVEDEIGDDDEFQNKMRFRDRVRKDRPGGPGIGSGERWSKDMEKPYSPIKGDDLPLDKFLKSKYKK